MKNVGRRGLGRVWRLPSPTMDQPLILVTNDDGIGADGLAALAESAQDLGDVWVIAPEKQQSATSHALTLHKPLRVSDHGHQRLAISGTPTDAVFFGVLHALPRKPDLILSGINRGPNLAADVTYSGTVSAALEAAIIGVPGIAFSHVSPSAEAHDYRDGSHFAKTVASRVLEDGLPDGCYLNVNFPKVAPGAVRGVKATVLGDRYYDDCLVECTDPRGRPYYWIGGNGYKFNDVPGSDCNAIDEGFISVTLLRADPTAAQGVELIRQWGLDGP
ncbi:MAG TPA: 5'/3'-nucleotidase SurE [Deltaproteobacteria bacterium]|nr:5'/3'-nucleotidase SurE [Deltaproteobacteria bacterium]HCP48255.1 5'/3'-nucleotidase SurE [Deltaproteobacteria bacterium]